MTSRGHIDDVVTQGKGDWDEGKYWLDKIMASMPLARLDVSDRPVPYEPVLLGRRKAGHYPGTLSTILETNAFNFLDPATACWTIISSWSSMENELAIGRMAALCLTSTSMMGIFRQSARVLDGLWRDGWSCRWTELIRSTT